MPFRAFRVARFPQVFLRIPKDVFFSHSNGEGEPNPPNEGCLAAAFGGVEAPQIFRHLADFQLGVSEKWGHTFFEGGPLRGFCTLWGKEVVTPPLFWDIPKEGRGSPDGSTRGITFWGRVTTTGSKKEPPTSTYYAKPETREPVNPKPYSWVTLRNPQKELLLFESSQNSGYTVKEYMAAPGLRECGQGLPQPLLEYIWGLFKNRKGHPFLGVPFRGYAIQLAGK